VSFIIDFSLGRVERSIAIARPIRRWNSLSRKKISRHKYKSSAENAHIAIFRETRRFPQYLVGIDGNTEDLLTAYIAPWFNPSALNLPRPGISA
jgi:hypothetical protein